MPNLQDVARQAGVSIATASRALNGHSTVDHLLRQRVELAALAVGYRPNALGRGLRTQRTETVGIVIPTVTNPHFTEAVEAAQHRLAAAGFVTILSNAARDPEAELRDLLTLRAGRVDGLILAPTYTEAGHLTALLGDLPMVLMDRQIEGGRWDSVAVDVASGVREAVAHLAARGRRRIGLLAGPPGISTADEKLAGYREALRAHGLPFQPELVIAGEYTRAGGRAATEAFLRLCPPPDALLAANNLSAAGMVAVVGERGLRIPDQLALVGFDDTVWTALIRPALTVIAQPVVPLGAAAADLLLARLNGSAPTQTTHQRLPTRLIVRGST